MKEAFKKMLRALRLYHPLQFFYRSSIAFFTRIFYRFKYRKYQGGALQCNVCGHRYEQFVPDHPAAENAAALEKNHVIAGYGENIICPYCLSTARERLVIAMLATWQLNGKTILHLSPEKNVFDFLKKNNARIITADLSPRFYASVDKNVLMQDATALTFSDNAFDAVIANHILEHIPDDRQALKEIFRVLKPAGLAILQVPYSEKIKVTSESQGINDPALQSELYGQNDHVRIYALQDYIARLRHTGFEAEVITAEMLQPFAGLAIQKGECFIKISKPFTA